MKTYKGLITELPKNGIFVFGSNTQGRHSLGAAKTARDKFGAQYANPMGRQGQSYAIITKDLTKNMHPSIPRSFIENQISGLYNYALKNPDLDFYVAYSGVGKNLNAYSNQEMADMFSHIPIVENIVFEVEFSKLLNNELSR